MCKLCEHVWRVPSSYNPTIHVTLAESEWDCEKEPKQNDTWVDTRHVYCVLAVCTCCGRRKELKTKADNAVIYSNSRFFSFSAIIYHSSHRHRNENFIELAPGDEYHNCKYRIAKYRIESDS